LKPKPEVLLVGVEEGMEEACKELGCTVVPTVHPTPQGTVLVNQAIHAADQASSNSIMVYVNSDIFFPQQWMSILQRLLWVFEKSPDGFMFTGPRVQLKRGHIFDHKVHTWPQFWKHIQQTGRDTSNLRNMETAAEDYFVYRKGSLNWVPGFHIGRYVFDNHIVSGSKRAGLVRVSGWNEQVRQDPLFFGLHFEHDRSHQTDNGHGKLRKFNERLSKRNGGWGNGELTNLEYFIGRCDSNPKVACLKRTSSYKRWINKGRKLKITPYPGDWKSAELELPDS